MRLLCILLAFSLSAEVFAEREVRLKAFVTVTGRSVLLKDLLVDSVGVTQEELDFKIVDSPLRGNKRYSSRDIAFMMQGHKSLMDLSLLAPRVVKITRKADNGYVAKVREQLTKELLKQSQWKGHTIDLDFSTEDINRISEKNGAEFVLKSQLPSDKMDRVKMRLSFKEGKTDLGIVELNAFIRRKVFAVILAKDVKKGEIIAKSDLRLAQVWSDGKEDRYAGEFKQCVGYLVTKNMLVDSRIPKNHLGEPYYVRKGEIITVNAHIGNLRVAVHAQAMLDGKRGKVIRARNTKSGEVIDVKMIAPLVAEAFKTRSGR